MTTHIDPNKKMSQLLGQFNDIVVSDKPLEFTRHLSDIPIHPITKSSGQVLLSFTEKPAVPQHTSLFFKKGLTKNNDFYTRLVVEQLSEVAMDLPVPGSIPNRLSIEQYRAIQAHIRVSECLRRLDSRLYFYTDTPYPVITDGGDCILPICLGSNASGTASVVSYSLDGASSASKVVPPPAEILVTAPHTLNSLVYVTSERELAAGNPFYYRPEGLRYNLTMPIKLYLPVEEHATNFQGLILGPRGSTQKQIEALTGTLIRLRGRGSQRGPGRADGGMNPGDSDTLHVRLEHGPVVSRIIAMKILLDICVPRNDEDNIHKSNQLRELNAIHGLSNERFEKQPTGPEERSSNGRPASFTERVDLSTINLEDAPWKKNFAATGKKLERALQLMEMTISNNKAAMDFYAQCDAQAQKQALGEAVEPCVKSGVPPAASDPICADTDGSEEEILPPGM